ncbi:MAG: homoserine dehydrogenase [Hyphomicrobiales bacterium]|nr:homoserine dehydrogenase [Hyphomicrobiales bacterium]MDE2017324.1 homoserine dehydrogenase [Hyphomicrobiales bacterium]
MSKDRGPLTVGLAGCGQMGTDLVVQMSLMPGVRLGAIVEIRPEAARAATRLSGRDDGDVVVAGDSSAVDRAIEAGKVAIVEDHRAMCGAGRIDVVIDATGNPNAGTLVALEAMRNGKHVVMLSVEADITVGRLLREEADRAGVVYTGAAGDEPAATVELVGFAQALGFEIVCAGKGKNNPLKFDATPDAYEAEARARDMNARMLVEFVDGSKTMIEMTAVANATGLVPDVPGMHGPAATREELASTLCTKADGGILSGPGRVDYSIGKGVAPGVFVVVKPRHPRALERMVDLKVGKGPCFALLRPYHLTSLEVPLSAIRAARGAGADLKPLSRPVAECGAVAKRALAPGAVLGKIGEYDYRGHALRHDDARAAGALPIGLAERARVLKPVAPGEALTYANCAPDEGLVITKMRRRQDQADARSAP